MIRLLKAFNFFIRNYEWVNEPKWEDEDEKAWTGFLATPTGQNASAVMKKAEELADACGRAKGFRGCVATLESLATQKLNSAIPGYGDGSDEPVAD